MSNVLRLVMRHGRFEDREWNQIFVPDYPDLSTAHRHSQWNCLIRVLGSTCRSLCPWVPGRIRYDHNFLQDFAPLRCFLKNPTNFKNWTLRIFYPPDCYTLLNFQLSYDSKRLNFSHLRRLSLVQCDAFVSTINLQEVFSSLCHLTVRAASRWRRQHQGVMDLTHLPSTLRSLDLREYEMGEDQGSLNLDHLPASLEILQLGDDINVPIDHLPQHLKHLEVGSFFCQPLDHLPSHLHTLIFATAKKRVTDGQFEFFLDHLPCDLKILVLPEMFYQPLDHLPSGLEALTLHFFYHEVDHLPSGLRSLRLLSIDYPVSLTLDHLPSRLEILDVHFRYKFRSLDHLPSSLKVLIFKCYYNPHLDHLPLSLEKLVIESHTFDRPLNHLPPSLQKLVVISQSFSHTLDHLPASLLFLTLECQNFNHALDWLPKGLLSPHFSSHDGFRRMLLHLPPGLRSLVLPSRWNSILGPPLPQLQRLCLGSSFHEDLSACFDPSTENSSLVWLQWRSNSEIKDHLSCWRERCHECHLPGGLIERLEMMIRDRMMC